MLLRYLPAPAQPAQGPPALPPAGPRRTQRQARRQVHLQLLGVPEPAGYLGHRPGAAESCRCTAWARSRIGARYCRT
ncbi:hypothetical protein ABFY65_00430 [Pseudomonas aeruginosa]